MPLLPTARASFKGAFTIEKLFAILATLLQARKILAGGYDPGKTEIVDGRAYTITSATQGAELFGFGSQLHRMLIYHFKATGGAIPTTAIALPAAAGGVAAEFTVTFTDPVTTAGTYIFRAGSYLVEDVIVIGAAAGADVTAIGDLLEAAINANPNLPFTAVNAVGVVTLTANTLDITTDDLSVTFNQKTEEAEDAPGGQSVAVVKSVAGVGKSVITSLWTYLELQTTPWQTGIIHPYIDTLELDSGSVAIGNPNQQTGLYDALDYRPGTIYTTDTDGGEAALTAAIALGDGRKLDAGNLRFAAPDYPELGYEIAAFSSGMIEIASMIRSSSAYTRLQLSVLYGPLDPAQDWTTKAPTGIKPYNNVDNAVKAGITPIIFEDNIAHPGDVTGFWHPDDNQNAPFKYQVNRWKIWNFQNIENIFLNGEDNKDRPIVNSIAAVKQSELPIDTDTIKAGLAQIAGIAARFGWIFDSAFTIRNTVVTESEVNPDRFDIVTPIITSGNNRINLGEIQVDRNLQAVDLTLQA